MAEEIAQKSKPDKTKLMETWIRDAASSILVFDISRQCKEYNLTLTPTKYSGLADTEADVTEKRYELLTAKSRVREPGINV